MNWSDIPRNPSPRVLRQFSALCVLLFGALAVWEIALAADRHPLRGVCLGTMAAVIGPLGLFRPQVLRPIFVGWMIIAFPPGWLSTRLMLAIVFYGVFTPMGLLFRLVGRSSLDFRLHSTQASYWTVKRSAGDAHGYFRQF
jgi:hypothetical protein